MKKIVLAAAAVVFTAGIATAQDKGPSGVFTSEGFGFNEGLGSFSGATSGGQGFGGSTGANSNASLNFNTTNTVRSTGGQINAGNFATRNTTGNFQSGAFGVWGQPNDFLAIGSGSRGTNTGSTFQGHQFNGTGNFGSTTRIQGQNATNTTSRYAAPARPAPRCDGTVRSLPGGATKCASEGGICWTPRGSVVFFGTPQCAVQLTVRGDIRCAANTFGGKKPVDGAVACYSTATKMR